LNTRLCRKAQMLFGFYDKFDAHGETEVKLSVSPRVLLELF